VPDFNSINIENLPLSLVDDLTQLCNRRFIFNNMPKIITSDEIFSKKTSMFMIDIDNFKKINDTFGHLVGDMVLMELARIMKKTVAEKGIVARYAGDEFLILLPGQEEDQAHKIGEAILQSASEFRWSTKDKDFTGQGLSVGIAVYPDDNVSMIELINCADQALYAAKKAGKNQIFHYKSVSKEMKSRIIMKQVLLRPPLVNRKEELDNIKEHYKISESAKKQGILVEGELGIGKTRLIEEFAGWTKKQNIFSLFCKLEQKEEGGPLAALAELLRLLVNSLGADKFGSVLAKLIPSELAEILYLYPPAKNLVKNASVESEPERRAENLFSGLCKILANATGEKTLALVVDDLHCANQITLQFFSVLLGISDIPKLLFIGAYGKENVENLKDLLAKGIFTTIKLRPLMGDEVGQLIASIFPDIKLESEQIESMLKTSKGNPLLLCEILKNLVEKGHIQYEDDRWKLKDINIKDIPDSLSDVIEPLLADLDDETKEMLSAMAVMGSKIELNILENFSGHKEGYLMELLDRAVKAGIIKLPDSNYDSLSFRTELIRKALADKVSVQKADSIHLKLVELIKQEYKDELPAQLDRLTHHLGLANEKELALKYKNISQKLDEEFSLPAELNNILEKIEKQKEAPVSIEELLEKPLSEASTKIIKDAILGLRAAIIGTLLYPLGNNMRLDLENRAYEIMLKILKNDPTLTISNVEGKVLVNGYAPKHLDIKNTIGFTLVSLMEDYSIGSITFKRDLRREEFAYLLRYFANLEEENTQHEGLAELLKRKGISHIKVDQVRYEKLSEIAKTIKTKRIEGGISSIAELSKDSLLDMPVEQYFDPKISGKLGLIAEALILSKNNEKVKNIVDKFSEDLNTTNVEDKSAIAEGAMKLSESLLMYERSDLLETLIKALLNRFNNVKQLKEFTNLCNGLQTMAVRLIGKRNFNQAGTIINHFKEQVTADSNRTPEQKKIVEDGLREISHPRVVEALISAFREKLKSDNPANITDVLEALGGYALDSTLNILTQEGLHEKDPFELFIMRHSAAMILKKIGQPAKDALKKMLMANKPSFVVKNIIEVLGYIDGKEFASALAPFLHSDSLEVRMQCVATLRKIGTIESLKILIEALKDKDEDIKQAASSTITELADQSFIKELKPLLAAKSTENIARSIIKKIETKNKK
jgi:diguanylate cyclase (GGDEF)-like protein